MITAAAVAMSNRLPILFLPGDTFANRMPDPVLQQVEHFNNPGITQNDGFKPVVRYFDSCLLYTSDAADERSSVDLGGRRIIKK